MKIPEWASHNYPLDDGWWVSRQFDNAVMWLGRKIENMLDEYDQLTKKRKYTLDQLLQDSGFKQVTMKTLAIGFPIIKVKSKQNGTAAT